MTRRLLAPALIMLLGTAAPAHRLDEYLQGTILAVTKDRLSVDLTLTPGVAIFPFLIADIDTNGDGSVSDKEQHAYAERVLGDLSLRMDGHPLTARLTSAEFPPVVDMKEGRGEIRMEFVADLPGGGASRKLVFENHHQNRISVYQVNVLAPRDPDIRIVSQNRNYTQSFYELNFERADIRSGNFVAGRQDSFGIFALVFVAGLVLFLRWRNLQVREGTRA